MRPAIAIVGMACRYPDARSPEELWENVLAQRRAFRRMPAERLRLEDYYSPNPRAPDRTYATQAALIEGYEFDRVRFRVVGSTYRSADLAHWLALDVAAGALADAGFADGEGLPKESTGVLVGNTLTGEFSRASVMRLRWPYVRRVVDASLTAEGWAPERRAAFLSHLERAYKQPFPPVGEETLAGGLSNTIAGRICNHFDFKGGGYTVDGACAASLLAVINACSALVAGDLDVALAGGVDLSLDPFELVGFAKIGALAPEKMRIYDTRSAGFWPGEGCGMLVLMRRADALARDRRIYATIHGWGISSDGSGGITRPEEDGQRLSIDRAYRRAGFGIDTVAYLEGHGTGTEVGDATELRVLSQARRESAPGLRPAPIGSIKANIGHTKAAAGVAGLIKATLALHHQVLPPTTGCESPHAELTGDAPALCILEKGRPWPADSALRAGVSAMGFGGINTHVVLEGAQGRRREFHRLKAGATKRHLHRLEAGATKRHLHRLEAGATTGLDPKTRLLLASAQDVELFLLGAEDTPALRKEVDRLLTIAPGISQAELADLAACLGVSADARRASPAAKWADGSAVRASIVASTPAELADRLETLAAWLAEGRSQHIDGRLGVCLGTATAEGISRGVRRPKGADATTRRAEPRIGFLFPGQGSPAHLDGGALRRRFDVVDELYTMAALPTGVDGVATQVAQPAIITASIAALEVLERLGVTACVAVGHSLGELAAFYWGRACNRDALLRIARARGEAMAKLGSPTGSMAGFRAGREEVEQLMDGETVVIAGLNSPRQTVISGESEAVASVMARAKAKGVRAVRLAVSHAFHSPLVEAAAPVLAERLARERFQPLRRRVISTVTGARLAPNEDLAALLRRQVTSPVRFMEAAQRAAEDVDLLIEVGPGEVLSGLAADFIGKPVVPVDAGGPSLAGLLRAVGAAYALGAPIKRAALFGDRFTRPFDIDRRPKFFVNPCERAPVSETGWRQDEDMAVEDVAEETESGEFAPSKIAGSWSGATPLEVVRRLVAERTELPVSAVKGENRLLGDLHLNSIAVGQLVAESARRLGLPPPVATTDYADATVAAVAQALVEIKKTGRAEAGDEDKRPPPGVDAWIRPFTVELVERPLPRRPKATAVVPPVSPPAESRCHKEARSHKEARCHKEAMTRWRILAPPGHRLKDVMEEAFAGEGPSGGVVLCLPPRPDEKHIGLLLEAARSVMGESSEARFVVVQHGGGGAALARTLHLERPDITTCVVDVPPDHPEAAEWVLAEATAATGYSEAHYDASGRRRVPRLTLLEPESDEPALRGGEAASAVIGAEAASGPGPGTLGPEDVLLVTGGGKGIAAECALALARETGVRLALLGRSKPEANEELSGNLERMADAGVTTRYLSADVTHADDVQNAVREVQAAFGPVTAVLHGAGMNVPQLLASLDEAAFQDTLRPKLQGARNVLAALDPDRLRLFVAFGSIIAHTGMQGEAHYAVTNDWLAHLVDRWHERHPHCRCLTLEWSVWSGVGMGQRLGRVDILMRQGITPIPTDEGINQLRRLLARPTSPTRVIIAGRFGEPPTLKFREHDLPLLRFVEQPRVHIPGVELVLDIDLTTEADPYLDDHMFAGARLFPAVMGLEAMAQASMALADRDEPPVFENVKFNRPVAVSDGEAETLRIAALRRTPGKVDVVLRTKKTGFQIDHFSATCLFDEREAYLVKREASDEGVSDEIRFTRYASRVDIDPERDLYGGILFQSGRFRRLRGYRRLMATDCLAEIGPGDAADWFGRYLPQELVLGDPGARDAALHAIQPCIPHARILPIAVERIVPLLMETAGPRFVSARERSRNGDAFIYDLEITRADGTVCERWEGLHLQVVEDIGAQGAWIEPLLGPYLERRVRELIPGADVNIYVARDAETDRRRRSNLAIRQALGSAGRVARRPDGKPQVSAAEDRAVSAAHAGDLTMAVAGQGPIGCDVEPVSARGTQAWRDLLGPERSTLIGIVARQAMEDHDTAATRIWAACECLKKAGASLDVPLVFALSEPDGWVILSAGSLVTATVVVPVRGAEEQLAFAVLTRSDRANL